MKYGKFIGWEVVETLVDKNYIVSCSVFQRSVSSSSPLDIPSKWSSGTPSLPYLPNKDLSSFLLLPKLCGAVDNLICSKIEVFASLWLFPQRSTSLVHSNQSGRAWWKVDGAGAVICVLSASHWAFSSESSRRLAENRLLLLPSSVLCRDRRDSHRRLRS